MSQNEYAYCLENPLLYVDRDGRTPSKQKKNDYVEISGIDRDQDMNSGSTGFYVSIGAGVVWTVKVKVAYDDEGNKALQVEVSAGPGVGEEATGE